MTKQDIRDIVEFVRFREPKFYVEKEELSLKVTEDSYYYCNLYDRRSQLLPKCKEYAKNMDEVYVQEALRYFNTDD